VQALHESRVKAAARELSRYRHLNQDSDPSAPRLDVKLTPEASTSHLPSRLVRLLAPILLVGFAAAHVMAAHQIDAAHRLVHPAASNELIVPAGD
jgi:hypothetical protein